MRRLLVVPAVVIAAGLGLTACGSSGSHATLLPVRTSASAPAAPATTPAPVQTTPAPVPTTPAPAPTTPAPTTAAPAATGVLPPASVPGATNPDVTQANIGSTICTSGWTETVRPPESYTENLKEEQLDNGYAVNGDDRLGDYEEDHLIPLELGGSPSSTLNLWPEQHPGSYTKDGVEDALNSAVCNGQVPLAAAQQAIATNWTAAEAKLGLS